MNKRRRVWLFTGFLAVGVVLGASLDDIFPPAAAQTGQALNDREADLAALAGEVALLERQGTILKSVVRLASPSIVHIEAKKMTGGTRPRMIEEAGSGIIIAEGGGHYVMTNRHVIRDAARERILVRLHDGREIVPTRVWSDPETDIAVMAISAQRLIPAEIGDSSNLEIGEFVLAVGSPFGLSRSVTFGIISAKGRRDLELGGDEIRYQDFLQTDAAINPGNSGGPLLNLRCQVIGMNTAIASSSGGSEGIGFTIPINMAMVIAKQLIEHGYVARAFLGVNLDAQFTAAMAEQLGLPRMTGTRVTGITPNSPAASSQLKVGDVILSYDGTAVEDDIHLVNMVSLTPINKEVPVVIFRDGQEYQIRVRVGDRAAFNQQQQQQQQPPRQVSSRLQSFELGSFRPASSEVGETLAELGLKVVTLDGDLARELEMSPNVSGLLVTGIDPAGPAAGRIVEGEVIDLFGSQPISSPSVARQLLKHVLPEEGIKLHITPSPGRTTYPRTVLLHPNWKL